MSRNTGSVASSDKSWLKLYAAVAALPLVLTACGGGGGGGGSPTPAPTPAPTPSPTPAPTPTPTPAPSPGPSLTWTDVSVAGAPNLTGVDYAAGQFVAVSDTGSAVASTDGATWTPVTLLSSGVGTDHLKAAAIGHSGSTLVAVGSISSAPYSTSAGAVAVSTNGTTWTMATLPSGTTPLHGLIAGPTLVALGESGLVYFSTNNGTTWTAEKPLGGTIGTCNAGAYGKNSSGQQFYVGVCDNGYMAESANGSSNWESGQVVVISGAGVNMHGVAWTGSQFVAVGDNGAITTSANGVKWSLLKTSAITGPLRSVAVASDGTIVVVGDNGIETSTNGEIWTAQTEGAAAALMGVTYGNGEFVAVGSAGAVKTAPR